MEAPKDRLKTLRNELGLTQKELAKRLNLSFYQYKDLESGRVKISPAMAKLIFYETGYGIDWLLKGSGPKNIDRESREVALIFALMKTAEEIIADTKITVTPEKKVKSIMYVYREIRDKNIEHGHDDDKTKKQLFKYLDLAK